MSDPPGGDPFDKFKSPPVAPPLTPQVGAGHGPKNSNRDATGGLIPYKNVPALIGYYLGVFSLIPILGMVLAPAAFILGIVGLHARKKQPEVKGTAHAWVAIVLGSLVMLAYAALMGFAIFSAA